MVAADNSVRTELPPTAKRFSPTGPMLTRRHGATRDIAIGNDTEGFPRISVLDDGNVAAVVLGHQLRDILQIRVRRATETWSDMISRTRITASSI